MCRVVGVLVVAGVLVLCAAARPAFAAETATPDTHGGYVRCNLDRSTITANGYTDTIFRARCNTSGVNSPAPGGTTDWRLQWLSFGNWQDYTGMTVDHAASADCARTNQGGARPNREWSFSVAAKRFEGTFCVVDPATIGDQPNSSGGVRAHSNVGGGDNYGTFEAITATGAMPAWPSDWYAGGTPGASRDGESPSYDCWRDYRDLGGGEAAVDLHAHLLNPMASSPWVTEGAGFWTVTYDGAVHAVGKDATLHLPSPASRPAGGMVAVYHGQRSFSSNHVGRVDSDTTSAWQIDDASPSARYLRKERQNKIEQFGGFMDLTTRRALNGIVQFFNGTTPLDVDVLHTTTTTTWDTVNVECGVALDYAASPEIAKNEVAPPGAVTTAPPSTGPYTGGSAAERAHDKCSYDGWGSGTPVLRSVLSVINVVRSLSCLLVPSPGAFDGMWDGVSTQFPANVASGAVGALTSTWSSVGTAIDAGNGCVEVPVGSMLNVVATGPLSGKDWSGVTLRLPAPASAGCASLTRGLSGDADTKLGDLFGFRTAIRALLLFLMWLSVAYRVVGSIVPAPKELEVGGDS
jgi:hypothetical protein